MTSLSFLVIIYFNPHHHAGGDTFCQVGYIDPDISIHTTTQVVTQYRIIHCRLGPISIHTTTQVVTQALINYNKTPHISIHTTTQVVTDTRGNRTESG